MVGTVLWGAAVKFASCSCRGGAEPTAGLQTELVSIAGYQSPSTPWPCAFPAARETTTPDCAHPQPRSGGRLLSSRASDRCGFRSPIVRAPFGAHARVKGNAHGHRVRQRDAVFSRLYLVSPPRVAVALAGEAGHFAFACLQARNLALVDHRFSAGELPANQFDRQPAAKDNARRLGVHPDVVLGGGSYVPFAAGRSTHDHAAADLGGDVRSLGQGERHIGERR